MPNFIDLTGFVFGRLTVTNRAENASNGDIRWNCQCECGNKTVPRGMSLRRGETNSCGCLQREIAARDIADRSRKHGVTTRLSRKNWADVDYEYKAWSSMRMRVRTHPDYVNRTICLEWNSYQTFLMDMGKAPSNKHQIDRIENSLGYFPGNCRWATPKENARNRGNNRIIEWKGQSKCLAEWEEELVRSLGMTKGSLRQRLDRGWSVEKAFTHSNQSCIFKEVQYA